MVMSYICYVRNKIPKSSQFIKLLYQSFIIENKIFKKTQTNRIHEYLLNLIVQIPALAICLQVYRSFMHFSLITIQVQYNTDSLDKKKNTSYNADQSHQERKFLSKEIWTQTKSTFGLTMVPTHFLGSSDHDRPNRNRNP